MNFCKKHLKAFTLLECLVALLTISLSLLVIQGMTRLLTQEFQVIRLSETRNWQNFSNLMRRELEQTELESVTPQFLYVKTADGVRRFGKGDQEDDFRKTNALGQGYQPMLYGLSEVNMSQSGARGQCITIRFRFKQGGERTFIYGFANGK